MSESSQPPTTPTGLADLVSRMWLPSAMVMVVIMTGGFWFWNITNDTGYAPRQPIAFSHKQHAGDLKLDCRFCHFNAERGKQAGVPPMSVCMTCHNAVATDKKEVVKLASIAANGSYADPEGVVHEGGMVHWNRVHRLPDHVYFPHSNHVAAGVACQTCHGPVQDMVVVRQHADLTMGWCLDCHRRSNYVGGPEGNPNDPTTWTVGVANYAAVRDREVADPVVVFRERMVKGSKPETEGIQTRKLSPIERMAAYVSTHPEFATKIKDLPVWRAADLPDSHRLMNAATQCSTCHQ
ncbi:MAG: cytochrome c3 family protein [Planctomycetota bacterium]